MTECELLDRTTQFALRVFKLVGALPRTIQGKAVAAQLIRSGTFVAANYRAACRARSNPNSLQSFAWLKKKRTKVPFWLELIIETDLLSAAKVKPLLAEAGEIAAIMASSKKTASRVLRSQIANRKPQIS
jgi:four helix bundle protein